MTIFTSDRKLPIGFYPPDSKVGNMPNWIKADTACVDCFNGLAELVGCSYGGDRFRIPLEKDKSGNLIVAENCRPNRIKEHAELECELLQAKIELTKAKTRKANRT